MLRLIAVGCIALSTSLVGVNGQDLHQRSDLKTHVGEAHRLFKASMRSNDRAKRQFDIPSLDDQQLGFGCYPYKPGYGSTELTNENAVDELNTFLFNSGTFGGEANFTKGVDILNFFWCPLETFLSSAVEAGFEEFEESIPLRGRAAKLCRGSQRRKHTEALLDSLAVGTFGASDNGLTDLQVPIKDCSAFCVYDIRNPNHHFRWKSNKGCYEFKKSRGCKDATDQEETYATSIYDNICPVTGASTDPVAVVIEQFENGLENLNEL